VASDKLKILIFDGLISIIVALWRAGTLALKSTPDHALDIDARCAGISSLA